MWFVGLGIGLLFSPHFEQHDTCVLRRTLTAVLAVAFAQGSHLIQIPAHLPILLLYTLVALKLGIVIFLVVVAGYFTGSNDANCVNNCVKHQ